MRPAASRTSGPQSRAWPKLTRPYADPGALALCTPVAVKADSTYHVPPEGIRRRNEATTVVGKPRASPGIGTLRDATLPLQLTSRSGFVAPAPDPAEAIVRAATSATTATTARTGPRPDAREADMPRPPVTTPGADPTAREVLPEDGECSPADGP